MHDVVIIGGGPAGLSAALVLGRCRRDIVVVDAERGRNRHAREMHGYLTRDGMHPADFRAAAREELDRYGVPILADEATDALRDPRGHFRVTLRDRGALTARKMLLATGVADDLPQIEGIRALYGVSVHHCPYCDGWEHRDQRIVAYGKGNAAVGLALNLRTWTAHVTACTDGEDPSDEMREHAARNRIPIRTEPLLRLHGDGGELRSIEFHGGPPLECDALFFNTGQYQRSNLPSKLGCAFNPDGGVKTSNRQCTVIPGLYLAGDADKDVQFVIVAAAEGATAAVAINRELQDEDRGMPPRPPG